MEHDTSFRGSEKAKIDDKGRLKIPSIFRGTFAAHGSREVFVTTEWCDHVQIYPLPAWIEIEKRLLETLPVPDEVESYIFSMNSWGQVAEIDAQDRILIHPALREKVGTIGDVQVQGATLYLGVWDRARYEQERSAHTFTKDDKRRMTELLKTRRSE
jgi:MraZ protein